MGGETVSAPARPGWGIATRHRARRRQGGHLSALHRAHPHRRSPPPIPGRSRARPSQSQAIHCAVERHGCQSSVAVLLSSPAAAQRCAEGAGLDSGAATVAQSAMPSIALPATAPTADHLSTNTDAPAASHLQSRISTSLTDVTLLGERKSLVFLRSGRKEGKHRRPR